MYVCMHERAQDVFNPQRVAFLLSWLYTDMHSWLHSHMDTRVFCALYNLDVNNAFL